MNKNKGRTQKILAAILVALLLSATAGCGGNGVFMVGGGETKYRTEKTIYFPMEKVRTLNPMISKDEDTYFIGKLIFDGLFELDERLEPQANLVGSYSYSEDKLTLTMMLKQGVKWHDGTELTTQDVKFSIDNYISLSNKNETIYADYVSNIKSVNLVRQDPYEFSISFRNSVNVGLENLVFPILPANQFKKATDIKKDIEEFIPIGTGPYRLSSYNGLSKLVLTANEDYRGAIPSNTLEFIVFPQKKDAMNLIDIENISLLINDETDRDALTSNLKVDTVNFISNQAEFIAFNMRSETMGNKKIRQAVAHAADSAEILLNAYLKSGILSDTIYYPHYFGRKNEGELYEFDLNKAAALIKEAGFKNFNDDGHIVGKDEKPITVRILVNEENPARVAAAQIIKNALDKLPLDSYIIYSGWDEYLSAIESFDYDMYIGGYSFNERYDLRNLLHSDHGNKIGYSNPALDELLDEMQSGVTNLRKAEAFEEVDSILKDEIPYYCIIYRTYGAISSSALSGEVSPLFNDYYRGCCEWECVYEIPAAVAE